MMSSETSCIPSLERMGMFYGDSGCRVTLFLGFRPRQGLAKAWAKSEAWESHFIISGM
jgi:hypothetical protein